MTERWACVITGSTQVSGVSIVYFEVGNGIARLVPGVERSFCSRNMSRDSISIPRGKDQLRNVRTADCGDAFQEVEGVGGGGAGEGLDEDYAGGRLGTGGVEALDTDWHCGDGGGF